MDAVKTETNSTILDYRIYVNENFEKYDYDQWLFEQLNLTPGLSVLDLGCGTGKHLFKFPEIVGENGNIVGVDISEESLTKCRRKIEELGVSNITVYKSDLTRITETVPHKFDRILSSFAIYYTQDEHKTFNDCYALLNKNGSLFVCGPANGTNAEFLELVRRAGGTFSNEFIQWSRFLEDTAIPLLKKIFGNLELITFENPIEFPNEEILFNYWKATPLYNPALEDAMSKIINDEFGKNGVFVNKKIVLGLRCTRYE
ncbi:MAG: class I SAM-dependent methyltransferase [Nanoarchaeota archaeon]|nr:class I SAM-dependent methyltransferase [Nanoarchaeota archaeon]